MMKKLKSSSSLSSSNASFPCFALLMKRFIIEIATTLMIMIMQTMIFMKIIVCIIIIISVVAISMMKRFIRSAKHGKEAFEEERLDELFNFFIIQVTSLIGEKTLKKTGRISYLLLLLIIFDLLSMEVLTKTDAKNIVPKLWGVVFD